MKFLGLFFAAAPALAHYHDGVPHHHPHGSQKEYQALMEIENVCHNDIETRCRAPEETRSDPFFQWFMTPERLAMPPMMHPAANDPLDPQNIGMLIDHMMDTAMRMPMMVQPEEPVFFLFIDSSSEQEEEHPSAPEEQALDSMLTKLIQQSDCNKHKLEHETPDFQENETPDLHQHIRLKGEDILKQPDVSEERRRLARRLTEISPEEYMARATQHHPMFKQDHHHDEFHGICPRKLQCLMQAKEQHKLSPVCADAITRLEQAHAEDTKNMQEMALYMSMFWFYCMLCMCLFAMIVCRKWKANSQLFWLRLKVLQAVYSNPEIKAKVEDELSADIGATPPVGQVGLKMMSKVGREECSERRIRFFILGTMMLFVFTLDTLGYLPEIWPFVFMGLACVFIIVRMGTVCFSEPPVRECSCCCCGGSTLDVENGTVGDAQACCACCKGSGVCAVKCSTCCGISDSGKGCCGGSCGCGNGSSCDGSCGCCGCCAEDASKDCTMKKRTVSNMVIYEGVPIQVV